MKQYLAWVCMALLLAGCGGSGAPHDGLRLAYVTNGVDPFWNVAAAGVRAAEVDFDIQCEVLMPPKGIADQKRMIENLLTRGVNGIAISPIDAENQVEFINQAAAVTHVITQDSDAPESNRLCFVGMDNYRAGRQAGQLVKEVLPEGGSVMIFVGRLEQLNAKQRRQGIIDEILDRPVQDPDSMQYDPPGFTTTEGMYRLAGTRTDNFDYAKAKSNAEDAIAAIPELGCMVGLFAYNIPACLAAVKEAGRIGAIKLVSFDEADDTLEGITKGEVYGTISQQPYYYGYESVRILAGLARGDQSVLPANGYLEVPSVVVRQDNISQFWQELNTLRGEG